MLFISYTSIDRPFVTRLSAGVTEAGIESWVDREDLVAGDRWRGEVMNAIDDCTAMVVVLSHAADESREVRREVEAADRRNKKIIPVIKDACNPRNLELILAERHWINFSTGDFEGGMRQLLAAVEGRDAGQPQSPMTARPMPQQIVGAWQVWIQHPFFGGFGTFEFHPNGMFGGTQSQPQGTVQIQGQWAFNGAQIQIQGMTNVGIPYNLLLTVAEVGQGSFKAMSHDGFGVVFQWAG